MTKVRVRKLWGGFCDGRLDVRCVDDHWGGANERPSLALFTNYKEAKRQYQDVRNVQLTYQEGHK
jgi:hypothetical protein